MSLEQPPGLEDKLETVSDLAAAQSQRDDGNGWGSHESMERVGGDSLDSWLASADGLGMLLAAVIADV